MGYKGRDVEVVPIDEGKYITIACDSCGAIGSKELDIVKVTPYVVGRLTARVALMETTAVGAEPKTIAVAISSEPYPTGEGIIEGIRDELLSMGLPELPMAVSTEKNIPTSQTGLGITVVGVCEKSKLRIASSKSGDYVYCLGIPKVGNEIEGVDDPDTAQGKHIQELVGIDGVHDIVPVGSKGILKEAEMMASNSFCGFVIEPLIDIDVNKSGGPSTCITFSCMPEIIMPDFKCTSLVKIGKLMNNADDSKVI